jgi:glycosyltransferase involved in cell wall biosynthesis
MQILIYESSSFGGCYEYAREIFHTYKAHKEVSSCTLLLPGNSPIREDGIKTVLFKDQALPQNKLYRKLHFLFRNTFNPFILFFLLLKRKESTTVIFNDFEQISAPLWVPFFKLFLSHKHLFAVILHDPDRDAYPPSTSFSVFCMKRLMSLMDFAFYHGFLPDKPYYYKSNSTTVYIEIPHGIYKLPLANKELSQKLLSLKKPGFYFLSIIGNIREEKNYQLSIQTLPSLPEAVLVIAGSPSHSAVNIQEYKDLSKKLNVEDRIIWIEKFLTEDEIAAVIQATDIILLNYAKSFSSQSGILNLIAPYQKRTIISKGNSSLSITAEKFYLGYMVEPDNSQSLIEGVEELISSENNIEPWKEYIKHASWGNMVSQTLKVFKEHKK